MARDLRQALDQAPDERSSQTWKPAVNDELIGRIVARDVVANKFKPEAPTDRLIVHTDEGADRTVYANHTVLRNKIQTLDPHVGDRIAIRRQADDPDKGYARYIVIVERDADAPEAPPVDDAEIPF